MNYKGLFCFLLVAVAQAFEKQFELGTPNVYLLNNDVREPQTLSLNFEDAPNYININFKKPHPSYTSPAEKEKLRYGVGRSQAPQITPRPTLAMLSLRQQQYFSELEAQISKQLETALLNQQAEIKEAIEQNIKPPQISSKKSGFDEHLNWLTSSKYADCMEALNENQQRSGVYVLDAKIEGLKPFGAYCQHDGHKTWLIIQRRMDGKVNFERNWLDYKKGFGNINGEYWLGLKRIHELTSKRKHELWFQMETYKGEKRTFRYAEFSIGDESASYRLKLDGLNGATTPNLNINYNNGTEFTTFDNDNDEGVFNCAENRKSGFWHYNCTYCNPNGVYKEGNDETGIYCGHWHEPMKYFHMAIRPTE